jgi:hypothetical protein
MRDCDSEKAPGPEQATVVFLSSGSRGFPFPIFDLDRLIGVAEPSSYFQYQCPPGTHRFVILLRRPAGLDPDVLRSHPRNWDVVEASLGAGTTTVIRVAGHYAFQPPLWSVPRLEPVSPEGTVEALAARQSLKCVQLDASLSPEEVPAQESRIAHFEPELKESQDLWKKVPQEPPH